jgi:hypothetical protein
MNHIEIFVKINHTCITFEIVSGSMLNGCFKILNIAIDVNAFSASNTFALFENTYIRKETADTLLINIINYS